VLVRNIWPLLGAGLAACSLSGAPAPFAPQHSSASQPVRGGYLSLYSFGKNGKSGDGIKPVAKLLPLVGMYGTTQYGGITTSVCFLGCGSVFRMTTSGAETILYRFKGGSDGIAPTAELIPVGSALFGTTSHGGTGPCSGGCGTVFKLDPVHKLESVIYAFKGGKDGAIPFARLTAFGSLLYGTTEYGGTHGGVCFKGCGTVFEIDPKARRERVIYRFKGGNDGTVPLAELISVAGAFYGTTQYGGTATQLCSIGCGTVFRLDAHGSERLVHRFVFKPGSPDGAYPAAGVTVINGALYGTTLGGGKAGVGTIFAVNERSGKERVIHSFACCNQVGDGAEPLAPLRNLNGTLYGTTRGGGANGLGSVFESTPAGVESVLYSFGSEPDGATPQAGLTVIGGLLYGSTSFGGQNGEGTVFRLTP
jgi:uncharacterized repeat protein (TIGR03803 family)